MSRHFHAFAIVILLVLFTACGSADDDSTPSGVGATASALAAIGDPCVTAADCTSEVCDRSAVCAVAPTGTLPKPVTTTGVSYSYGTAATELLTVYLPLGTVPTGGWPTMVAVHGGGATSDGGGRNSTALVYWGGVLNAQGIAFVTIDYPLVSGSAPSAVNAFPTQLNSTRKAACFIQAQAPTWGIDAARLGWTGFSYGGNLVSLLVETRNGTSAGTTALAALPMGCSLSTIVAREVLYYPNVDMKLHSPAQWSAYSPNAYQLLNVTGSSDPSFTQRAADATAVPAGGDPPLCTTDGDADTTVKPVMVRTFAAVARAVGVSVYDMAIPAGVHGASPTTGGIYKPESWQTNIEALGL